MRKTPYAFWLAAAFALTATAVFISIPTVPRYRPRALPPPPPLAAELASVTPWVHESSESAPGAASVQRGLAVELTQALPAEALRDALVISPAVALDWKALSGSGKSFRVPAALQAGQAYTVGLAPHARADARLVAKRLVLKVPRDEGRLEFVRAPPSLERKSRQLVHLALTSVQTLALEAQAVPPFAVAEETPALAPDAPLAPVAAAWRATAARLERPLAGTPFAFLTQDQPLTQVETFYEPGLRFSERRAALPLAWRKAARGGTVLVRAVSRDKGVAASTGFAAIQITDLAITLKSAPDALFAWVTRLSDGQPVTGANVFLCGEGRVLLAGTTGADGIVQVADRASLDSVKLADGARAQVPLRLSRVGRVLVSEGSDVAWAEPARDAIQAPRAAQLDEDDSERGHVKRSETTRAYLFTERGVYQPGDTVHVKVTARDLAAVDARVPRSRRVRLTVKNPRDSVVRTLDADLSAYGTAALDIPLTRHDRLGAWTLLAGDAAGKESWGRATFRVEEFVAPRHQVEVSFTEPPVEPGTPATARALVRASYHAGGPVKHGKVRWRVELAAAPLRVPGLPGYAAGCAFDAESALESGEATLEDDGTLPLDLPLPADVLAGRRALRVSATVLDFDGRAAAGSAELTHAPAYLVAISAPPETHPGDEVELSLAVVERATEKRVAAGTLGVELLREDYAQVTKRSPEGDAFRAYETLMARVMRTAVPLAEGAARVRLSVDGASAYHARVSFTAPDGHTYQSVVALTQAGSTRDATNDSDPERLPLSTDRPDYRPGQIARLLVRPERDVTAYLVTVERERVLSARVVRPSGDGGVIELPIEERYAPGATVAVLALHAREAFPTHAGELDARAPAFENGVAPLDVRPRSGGLALTLTGAGPGLTARPGAAHEVAVAVTGRDGKPADAEIALAVVDESVLALTGYETPDLTSLFVRHLPDLVSTTDTRHGLGLQTPYKYVTVKPLTGGDGGADPVSSRRRFEPVAYFKADLHPDASGVAKATFDLPDGMTAYRVFAVAVDRGEGHGRVAAQLVVTKPLYAEIGLPRFLTAGDTGVAQVAVFNHTAQAGAVALTVTATGGMHLDAPAAAVTVPAGDRALVPVPFRATATGPARLTVALALGQEGDAVTTELTVRAPYALQTEAVDGVLEGAAAEAALPALGKPANPALAAAVHTRLELSPLPALRLTGRLRQLLEYPYGCVEQTSSGVLPLATLRGLIHDGLVPGFTVLECDGYLAPGIQRLLSMQRTNGSFGYWPGAEHAHPFGSAYATFALVTARHAGAAVPQVELDQALDYLERHVVHHAKDDEDADDHVEVQALARLALAEAGRVAEAWAVDGAGLPEVLALQALAAQRGHRVADAGAALDALLGALKTAAPAAFDVDTFFSPRRQLALSALAALEVRPGAKTAQALLAQLEREPRWGSTQEEAWTVLALARALRAASRERARVSVLGQEVSLPERGSVTLDAGGAHEISLKRLSPGSVSFRLERTAPRAVDPDATPPVRRTYERLDGPGPIHAGDLVRVTLDLEPPEGKAYLALDDPLPAGLVPLNRALAGDAGDADASDGAARAPEDRGAEPLAPDHVELRDDRVVAFHDAALDGPRRFTWIGRAACAGTFLVPPARLEPMYQPEDAVFSSPAELVIEPAR